MASLDEHAVIRCAAMRAEDLMHTTAGMISLLIEQMDDQRATIDADCVNMWSDILLWIGRNLASEATNLDNSMRHDELVAARVAP